MLESLREVVKELNGERVLSDIDFSKTARSMTDEMKGLVGRLGGRLGGRMGREWVLEWVEGGKVEAVSS